jgi:hypothetical protein
MDSDGERQVEITPTSRGHADVSDIVLRQGDSVRLIFRPEIVDNPHDSAACIRGTFVYQRKGRRDSWEDAVASSLATLKAGQGFKLELKAAETLNLLRELSALWRHYRKQGIPRTRLKLVKLEERLAELFTLNQPELNALLEGNQGEALRIVGRVLHWVASSRSLRTLLADDPDRLPDLTASLGLASLREAIAFWELKREDGDEEFWQEALDRRAFLLAQLFHYPILLIRGKAYVGGKRLDNQHGNLADFLAKVRTTGGALLVEIKTPSTSLLGREYRQGVYPPSRDLGGALSQVLHYKSSLQREIQAIREGVDDQLEADEPRCLVIAGNTSVELTTPAKRRAFERFRERLSGVTVIGFDELFAKASDLLTLLSEEPF